MTSNQWFNRCLRRCASPPGRVFAVLCVALVLACLSRDITSQLRSTWQTALRPSLQFIATLKQQSAGLRDRWRNSKILTEQLVAARDDLSTLESEHRRLANQMQNLRGRLTAAEGQASFTANQQPLVLPKFVEARVLGLQGRALLNHLLVVDAGRAAQILPESFVLDGPGTVLDLGADAQLRSGQLVLDHYRVWGKIVEVGPRVSRVLPIDAPEYRDIVRIVDRDDTQHVHGRGMLEGTGQGSCRIRLVDTTRPVAVGDLVYSATDEEQLAAKLLYGEVDRVEREPGAPHWDITVRPSPVAQVPSRVTVLTSEINVTRLANRSVE